jgi:hypothetical protein
MLDTSLMFIEQKYQAELVVIRDGVPDVEVARRCRNQTSSAALTRDVAARPARFWSISVVRTLP